MFIKTIVKTDKRSGKRYYYFRLCEGYRIGDKVRHRSILSLGKLDELNLKEERKLLADRIEQLLLGVDELFDRTVSNPAIEKYAQKFYRIILNDNLLDVTTKKSHEKKETADYHSININSINNQDVREVGAEWLSKQTLEKLEIPQILKNLGWRKKDIDLAMIQIISRAVFPASENKTAQWIQQNSAVSELFDIQPNKINRYPLYRISKKLYQYSKEIERELSSKTSNLFDLDDKIIFYDLTNTYFEGRKLYSEKAKFGRSKEKRSDAKLISLALVVNAEGFVKQSKIYKGNIGESTTLEETIKELSNQQTTEELPSGKKPTIVMDAGISTEENLSMLKEKGYDYICVTRRKLKNYESIKEESAKITLYDKRNNPIEIEFVKDLSYDETEEDYTLGSQDRYLYVHSKEKEKKEMSMDNHFSQKFEEELTNARSSLSKKGGTKKLEKVWERIGRLKERYPSANKHYAITIKPDKVNDKAEDIIWKRKTSKSRNNEGVYFLRTSLQQSDEKTLWMIYNTLTEIEATFRVLKTDLAIRPIYHQEDIHTEAHINLGILAYQLVSTIRFQLKSKNINYDWRNIRRIMNTQKLITTSMFDKEKNQITIRKCSIPNFEVKEILQVLKLKLVPFYKRKYVVPEK